MAKVYENIIRIKDDASRPLKKVTQSSSRLSSSLANAFYSVNLLQSGLRAISRIGRTAVGIVRDLTQAAAEQEYAEKMLATALKTSGEFTEATFESLKEYASQLQQVTKYGDEVTLATMQNLAAYGMNEEQLKRATLATMDLASAKGIDLRTASELVGKAFVGETGTLSRYGIIIDKGLSKSEKFAAVLKLVAKQFGGAAQAELFTYAGATQQLANFWGDLKEALGDYIIKSPEVLNFIQDTVADLQKFIVSVKEGESSLNTMIKVVMDMVEGLKIMAGWLQTVGRWFRVAFVTGTAPTAEDIRRRLREARPEAEVRAERMRMLGTLSAEELGRITPAEREAFLKTGKWDPLLEFRAKYTGWERAKAEVRKMEEDLADFDTALFREVDRMVKLRDRRLKEFVCAQETTLP